RRAPLWRVAARRGHGHQQGVYARVVGELRVERAQQDLTIAEDDGMTIDAGEHIDALAILVDPRRPDEHRPHRVGPDPVDLKLEFEARDLPAERVTSRRRVHEGQVRAIAD